MIQVCSRCGTRWNVRDRRRAWCPRCNGALWAPLTPAQEAELQWTQPGPPAPAAPPATPRLGHGYRWIAVRPGPPPLPHRRSRPLGPTPHYSVMPRWTLMEWVNPVVAQEKSAQAEAPALASVQRALSAATAALGVAALVHTLSYLLMLVNRTHLLHPVVAGAALWLGRLASVAALIAVIVCAVLLTRWLIGRRAAAFTRLRRPESRRPWALWVGCLVPVVNLFWAPVYTMELASREDRLVRLRKPIVVWWLLWVASTLAALFATATSFATGAQGIANNTVAMVIAYLLGLAAVRAAARVVDGFERRSMSRPAHHWVVVGDAGPAQEPPMPEPAPEPAATPAAVLESDGREPAA
ncbi:DUF4328 domain-containing protein [Mycobacterium sp. M1]|uniref:DUF4328 domain-containing protein n=1 Tax=Mycolicibacter acidiphilus TaxID=2835306 RepID=A0ABS5RM00_9MYCO|nr:DUF4328 domain-containing protein [Mycolicibacter acidiphilus]MBS9535214.1 DUF4328 domain-containing protein [Mycolicibacter acidiphilus]